MVNSNIVDDASKITYQVESFMGIWAELEPFVEPHHAELGLDRIDVPVDMDLASYKKHEDEGRLHLVTVRDDGVLVGYYTAIITSMLHYQSTLHAVVDLYYLKPSHRSAKIGLGLFQYAEMRFAELGVVKIVTGSKLHLHHEKLFLGLGYKPTEVIYTKIIAPK